jgi:hemerythrin-like metal-binding protein
MMTFKALFEKTPGVLAISIVSTLFFTFFGIIYLLLTLNYNNNKNTATFVGQNQVNLIQKIIHNDLNIVYSDVLFLADQQALQKFLAEKSSEYANHIAQDLLSFSIRKGKYDQVRLLDETGMEIIRINYNKGQAAIVPKTALQFKGKRYYFNDAFKLQRGEIFVSPFDLNMERDKIETPLKPMIRFATPVFDHQNQKRGILLLNYMGNNLLKKMDALSDNAVGKIMLVNSAGYWLKHWKPEREWGFMFKARETEKMPNDFPQAWQQISRQKSGQLFDANGLFAFTTVYPAKKSATPNSNNWKIVYYLPKSALLVHSNTLLIKLLLIGLPLILILGISLFKLANAKIRQKQSAEYIKKQNVSFARFVPASFLRLLNKKDIIEIELGDQREQEMTVLVSNIYGFTTLSETMTAGETIDFINAYLKQVEPIIRNHHGFVSNYMAEKFVALFSNPDEAINAANAMLKQLGDYNQVRDKQNLPPILIHLGIDTGHLVLGTIGGTQRMESSVIGNTVNLAFSLESMNNIYGTTLLISEHTYTRLKAPSQSAIRFIERIKSEGLSIPLSVYDVFHKEAPDIYAQKLAAIQQFEEAVSYYQFQQIDQAVNLFEQILKQTPDDKAAQVYLQRCYKQLSKGHHDGLSELTRIIDWSDSIAIGIPLIDQQHKDLINNVNELIEAIRTGKGQKHIQKITVFLEDYVVRHFNDEEVLMQEYNYPGYSAHKSLHVKFIDAFNALKQELRDKQDKGLYLVFRVQTLVMDWFINHIAKVDKQLGVFLSTQLEKYNRTLENKVAERTQALKKREAQLEEAKKAAESANKAKSEFLTNMSHEIRTPMNAITGLTRLALKTELTDKQYNYLIKIENSAQALLDIINDILDFSKIEAGMLDMESVDFQLDDVLNKLSSLFGLRIEEKGLELLLAIDKKVPRHLVGDPLRLGQILINLTSNALKFTAQGNIVVKIEVVNLEPEQVTLRFSVQDTGIGISQESIFKLFDAFSQADTSTTRQFGGTGLGLTICKRLTEMMGGKIWAESQQGKGSTFSFTAIFGCQVNTPKITYQTPDKLCGIKILIVDDNETSLEIMQDELCALSFEAISLVSSGTAALTEVETVAKTQPYDLVLLDWKMPGMDGLETATRIKDNPHLLQKPAIIMMTAFSRENAFKSADKHCIDAFLSKPITQSTLFDTIMSVFGEQIAKTSHSLQKQAEMSANVNAIQGARILLAEDNFINQQIAQETLESEGLVVDIANNGKEAVAMIAKIDFDAVLMDVQMPEMDGYEATRLIRETPQYSELPIIAMTAHAMKGDKEKCLAAGMNDYITKPIEVDRLFTTLKKWVTPQNRNLSSDPANRETPSVDIKDFETFPDELPGIDITEGLDRLLGNRQLYFELLQYFHLEYQDIANQIKAYLDQGHIENVRHLLHTFKGVAGNLAINKLSKTSERLEKALKAENEMTPDLLKQFEDAVTDVMNTLAVLNNSDQ